MKFNSQLPNLKGNRNTGGSSGNEPAKVIRFVSLIPSNSIQDVDILKDIINSRGFTVDFSIFKVTNTKIQKRLINLGRGSGPRERIEIEEKVDVNSSYKYLRQVTWRVLKEVNNVLLLQLGQIKGVPCSLPLVFQDIFQEKRKILITGLTHQLMTQLISKPDLKFKSIPDPIVKNGYLRQKMLERADRAKTMQAIARTLQDFSGIPRSLKEKLTELSAGNNTLLSDEEAINVILVSDLYTRYFPLLQTFQNDINTRNAAVSALASQFAEMTQGIKTERLIDAFRNFLADEDGSKAFSSENNAQLFAYLYKRAQSLDEKRVKVGDMLLTRAELFSIMRSMITLARSQRDPELWQQCLYVYRYDDVRTSRRENTNAIDFLVNDIYSKLKVYHSASTQSLIEIHLINNIHRFITGRKVLISKSNLSDVEMHIIRSVILPHLYQPGNNQTSESVRLFLGLQDNLSQLINPIHTVARVYAFLMGRRLRESVQKFLKPGLRELLHRFGKNFFSIFYEMAVQEGGIPISRNQFAQWLELKQYFKNLEELGHIANELENHFDPLLKPEILMEQGISCFPNTYSQESFKEEYQASRKTFDDFLASLRQEKSGFPKLLADYLVSGNYDLRSSAFKDHIRESTIYRTLQEIVIQSCVEIRFNLKKLAVNRKVILKIPLEFESLLLIGNIFPIAVEEQVIQLHLIAVPVKAAAELEVTSRSFSDNFLNTLNASNEPWVKELKRANRILRLFQKVFLDYVRSISICVIDRQINSTILKIRQQKNQTPNHIKYHFENYEKLIIGNIKKLNLGKLIQFDQKNKATDKINNLSIAEVLQAVVFFRTATQKIRNYRSVIDQINLMMERYSGTFGEDYDSLIYLKQINKFNEMLATPVDELSENILNLITILAKKIHKTVRHSFNNDGVLVRLYQRWGEDHPDNESKINFYIPFMREDDRNPEAKLFLEIAKTHEILRSIKHRRCVVILSDKQQDQQLRYITEIGAFITEREFDIKMYVEIGGLNKEEIEELAKVYYPGNFFRMERIQPVRKQI